MSVLRGVRFPLRRGVGLEVRVTAPPLIRAHPGISRPSARPHALACQRRFFGSFFALYHRDSLEDRQ